MNYQTNGVLTEVLKCSKIDYQKLKNMLEKQVMNTGVNCIYMEREKGVLLFGDEFFAPEELNEKTKRFLGKIIKKAKLQYVEFGIAFTADKITVGSHGGTTCIITDDGSVAYQIPEKKYTWVDSKGQEHTLIT